MTFEQLHEEASKRPDAIWVSPDSVPELAAAFQIRLREPCSIQTIERGMRDGLLKVMGVPVHVYELV